VELRATLPHGFDYAAKSILVNGRQAGYREGSLIIPVGTMAPGEVFSTSFVMLVTSGVSLGKEYSMEFTIVGGSTLSEKATLKFMVQGDPVFEQGTILGKVFNDLNQNTVQDKGEEGVPWVRLYTEEGIGIVTDENGLYHIPGVIPGRHVVKIDGHSLPDETKCRYSAHPAASDGNDRNDVAGLGGSNHTIWPLMISLQRQGPA